MPRFYCDYCDAYLTHDSMSGRQQHMRGWKHRENFKIYYESVHAQWIQRQQHNQMQQGLLPHDQAQQFAHAQFPPGMGMMCPPPMQGLPQMMANGVPGVGVPQAGMGALPGSVGGLPPAIAPGASAAVLPPPPTGGPTVAASTADTNSSTIEQNVTAGIASGVEAPSSAPTAPTVPMPLFRPPPSVAPPSIATQQPTV